MRFTVRHLTWENRVILPLAVSHALLGSTFYYWVYGKELAARWLDFG